MGGEGKEVGEDSREFAPDFSLTQKKRYLKKKRVKLLHVSGSLSPEWLVGYII